MRASYLDALSLPHRFSEAQTAVLVPLIEAGALPAERTGKVTRDALVPTIYYEAPLGSYHRLDGDGTITDVTPADVPMATDSLRLDQVIHLATDLVPMARVERVIAWLWSEVQPLYLDRYARDPRVAPTDRQRLAYDDFLMQVHTLLHQDVAGPTPARHGEVSDGPPA